MQTTPHSLLPLTPDSMRGFRQEIVVDLAELTKATLGRRIARRLPEGMKEEVSYVAAFEALRLFREITQDGAENYSEDEKTQLARIEVEWCLDILGQIQRSGSK